MENTPRSLSNPDLSALRPGLSNGQIVGIVAVVLVLGVVAIALVQWAGSGSLVAKAKGQADFLAEKMDEYGASQNGFPRIADTSGLVMYKAIYGDGVGPDGLAGTADDSVVDGMPDPGAKVFGEDLAPDRNPLGLVDPAGEGAVPSRLVDPWGRSWRYRSGSLKNENTSYDFWSAGPDGVDHTRDDIRNW